MCGILGIGFNRDHKMHDKKNQLKTLLVEMFEKTQTRGRVATGIAAMNKRKLRFMKQKMLAENFVEKEEFSSFLDKVINFERDDTAHANPLLSIIGHCRLNTKGTPDDNLNNHPIPAGKMIGVHNGSISNDDKLFSEFESVLSTKRFGRVDSEIIFQLINYFYEDGIKNCLAYDKWHTTISAIQSTASLLEGNYGCALLNAHEPYRLYLFRNTSPIQVRYYTELGILVFNSVDAYITESINNIFGQEFNQNVEIDIPQYSGLLIDFDLKKQHPFDLNLARSMAYSS